MTHTQPFSLQWFPEVTHFCKKVPIIVVGCKIDLRKDKVLVNKLRKKKLELVTYHRVGRKLSLGERHLEREPQGTSLLCQVYSTLGSWRMPAVRKGQHLEAEPRILKEILAGR